MMSFPPVDESQNGRHALWVSRPARPYLVFAKCLGLSIGLAATTVSPVEAATRTWLTTGTQDWATAANWGGAVPTSADTVFVNTTGTSTFPIITAGAQNGADIYIGANSGSPSRLDIRGGSLTSNSTSTSVTGGSLIVAPDPTSVATLNLADTTTTGGALTSFGAGTGSVTSKGFFLVGRTAGANGTVNMNTSGSLAVTGELDVGVAGTGSFNLDGGTVTSTTYLIVGRTGTGTFSMSGGTVTASSASNYVSVGFTTGGNGTLNISGGSFTATRGIVIGDGSTGVMNLSGTGAFSTGGTNTLRIGGAAGTGTVNLNGGTASVFGVDKGSGSGTFNFNGGTLKANAANVAFMTGLTRANVRDGGAVIDTNSFNVTIGQTLLQSNVSGDAGNGGLTKNGAGTLTLSGASTYTGTTTVNAGTLLLSSTGSINGSTTVNITTGALTLQTVAGLSDTGTLSLVSGTTLNLSATSGSEIIGSLFLDGNAVAPNTYTAAQLSVLDPNITFTSAGETLTVAPVPEPATWAAGLLCLGLLSYHQKRRIGFWLGHRRSV